MTKAREQKSFGEMLLVWMRERGYETDVEFARDMGVKPTSIGHWRNDRNPSVDLLLFLEFDMTPPVAYRQIEAVAKPIVHPDSWRLYQRQRNRILRFSGGHPAGVSRSLWNSALRLARKAQEEEPGSTR